MTVQLLDLDPASYRRHPVHEAARTWTETNCYVDLWIEVLHALGLDPVAAAAFTLGTDFEGDQWTFFKYPPEDLRFLYGIDVAEMNVWLSIEHHTVEQLGLGRLLTVEVDSWYLPDATDAYRRDHVKSTIVPQSINPEARHLGYFHNAGYFELAGEDYEGVFPPLGQVLPPYVELVKLDRLRPPDATLVDRVRSLTADHIARRPDTNPMLRFRKRLATDVEWLATQSLETFHLWAFGGCRQAGASAELAASFVGWLDEHDGGGLAPVATDFQAIADAAKSLQFMLARAARGRAVDAEPVLDEMERRWDSAMAALDARYGARGEQR